jgi:hypothetical protein
VSIREMQRKSCYNAVHYSNLEEGIISEIVLNLSLTESRRRAIFATVVNSQDKGASVRQSRRLAAARFDVSWDQVIAIEREGLINCWSPLPPRLKPACSVADTP